VKVLQHDGLRQSSKKTARTESAPRKNEAIRRLALQAATEQQLPPPPRIGYYTALRSSPPNAGARNRLLIEAPNGSGTTFGTAWRFKQDLNY